VSHGVTAIHVIVATSPVIVAPSVTEKKSFFAGFAF
jgi:hypothetical protein